MEAQKATKKEVLTQFRTREILAAARALLEQGGAQEVTMEEIAARAGVAKGTLYLYFRSKDDLIQALLTQVGEQMEEDMERLLGLEIGFRDKLEDALELLLRYLERERVLFPLYLKELFKGGRQGTGRRHFTEVEHRILEMLTRFFQEGIAQGYFLPADPQLLTFLLRGLVRAVGLYQMAGGGEEAVRAAAPVVAAIVGAGFSRAARRQAGEWEA